MKHLSDFTLDDLRELALHDVSRALAEDVGAGDLTAALIDAERPARARIVAREAAVICGTPWVEAAVLALDPEARLQWHVTEGQRCAADQTVLTMEGHAQPLLGYLLLRQRIQVRRIVARVVHQRGLGAACEWCVKDMVPDAEDRGCEPVRAIHQAKPKQKNNSRLHTINAPARVDFSSRMSVQTVSRKTWS